MDSGLSGSYPPPPRVEDATLPLIVDVATLAISETPTTPEAAAELPARKLRRPGNSATPFPENFEVTPELIAHAAKVLPNGAPPLDDALVRFEIEKMRNWAEGKAARKHCWKATARNWLTKAREDLLTQRGSNGSAPIVLTINGAFCKAQITQVTVDFVMGSVPGATQAIVDSVLLLIEERYTAKPDLKAHAIRKEFVAECQRLASGAPGNTPEAGPSIEAEFAASRAAIKKRSARPAPAVTAEDAP